MKYGIQVLIFLALVGLSACVKSPDDTDQTMEQQTTSRTERAEALSGTGVGSQKLLADPGSRKKIINGKDVENIADHPWQVALLRSWDISNHTAQFCGGSVIDGSWILTAQHCVDNGTHPDQVDVLVGTRSLKSGGVRIPVEKIVVFPGYINAQSGHDVALLQVKATLPGQPVGLVIPDVAAGLDPNVKSTVTGWGQTASVATPEILQYLDEVPLVDRDTCNDPVSYDGDINDMMICAGFVAGGRDSCWGDSGGPLTVLVHGEPILLGVVSWGEDCAKPGKYGVYASVPFFYDWILANTN